jgi:cell division protein FtsZ
MGIGSARGEDRAIQAAETAISSPLLEASVDGAHGVLLSIQGGSDLGLFEINEAARLVQEAAHPEANIIFGAVIDDALGDEVRVTVIAAGFDGGAPARRRDDRALGQVSGRAVVGAPVMSQPIPAPVNTGHRLPPAGVPEPVGAPAPAASTPPAAPPAPRPQPAEGETEARPAPDRVSPPDPLIPPRLVELPPEPPRVPRSPRPMALEDDDLDVPDFLK